MAVQVARFFFGSREASLAEIHLKMKIMVIVVAFDR